MKSIIFALVILFISIIGIRKVNLSNQSRVAKNIIIALIVFIVLTLLIAIGIWEYVDIPQELIEDMS